MLYGSRSKHPLSGAEILLDPKRRKVERIVETQDRKTTSTGTRKCSNGQLFILSACQN